MKVTYIDASQAPEKPNSMTEADQETLEIIEGIKVGSSKFVWPIEGETIRVLKSSFLRVAKRRGVLVSIDDSDAGRAIKVTRLR